MYDTILVPTDGSRDARGAIEEAFDLAERLDASVHLLYVLDVGASYPAEFASGAFLEALEREGEDHLAELAADGEERGLEVVTAVRDGTPHREILEYAEGAPVDLIVMGTRGRRGIDRVLLGSVTERVVRLADVPVMTIRRRENPEEE